MDQHPIPRQVTTFEFKLIGFMTLKQFFAVLGAAPIAYIAFWLVGVFPLNAIAAGLVMLVGAAVAFVPINDRPMTVFLANLWKRVNSPTQYMFKRHIVPYELLSNLVFVANPHQTLAHIESKEKLAKYLQTQVKTTQPQTVSRRSGGIFDMFTNHKPSSQTSIAHIPTTPAPQPTSHPSTPINIATIVQKSSPMIANMQASTPTQVAKPFLSGVVQNKRGIPLPGILVYVKDHEGKITRILKSNVHGIFATLHPLASGDYTLEVAPGDMEYVFTPQAIAISGPGTHVQFVSQEVFR